MTAFPIPMTLAEVDALDQAERLDGLLSYENADPEPGPNRGRAFWWGWWCGKSPRPESDDPRDVEVYWVMRALAKEMRKAP